ncbi:MAG TPA: hypothetical protein VHG90_07930 [Acidimicrobiales bacterium]|nr:hypothetical protein [Acidimicrobiales bacterium]
MPAVRRRAAFLALAFLAATSGACSAKGSRPPPASPEPPPAPIAWDVTVGEVHAVRPPAPGLPDDVRAKVTATLERYLADAVVGPLRSGQPAADLGPVFTAAALARLNGPDRAALVDEGLPRAARLRSEAATARLGALAGADQAVTVVTAAVTLRLHTGGAESVAIVRTGDLVLVPDGDAWKVDGYDIRTARDSADGGGTTTTARG